MPLRIQKRKKIMPGVRVNIGKKGVSGVTLGKRGAGITLGKRGTRANVGIPGTGISYSTKLTSNSTTKQKKAPKTPSYKSTYQTTFDNTQYQEVNNDSNRVSQLPTSIILAIVAFVVSTIIANPAIAIIVMIAVGVLSYFLLNKWINSDNSSSTETDNVFDDVDEIDRGLEELDEYLRLSELHDSGELTDEEFLTATEKLL